MFSGDDYATVWFLYLASAVGVMLVWWKLTSFVPYLQIRQILRVLVFVILFTPWTLDGIEINGLSVLLWAPAFMVITMDTLTGGLPAATRAGIPLLVAEILALVAVIFYVVLKRRVTATHEG